MRNYRQPTEKEAKKLEEARKKTVEGIEGEKDLLSKISTTMAKSARDEIRAGKALRESVPAAAREGEAYNQAGFRKGGSVKSMNTGGLGRVNPTPKVPATPAKQNPNTMDKASKKPADPGFKEVLDRVRGKTSQDMPDNYRAGGTASKRADGAAQRGKTRGTIVMCGGGYMKGKKK
jgi:hypothetical protein